MTPTQKREQALVKKYGSPEALRVMRQKWAKKRKKLDPTKHGFGLMKLLNPERLKEISRNARKSTSKEKSVDSVL